MAETKKKETTTGSEGDPARSKGTSNDAILYLARRLGGERLEEEILDILEGPAE